MPRHVANPVVTVVMPAFNAERYIGDALRSIAAQTLQEVEVIVVDDGSTDGTLAEVHRIADDLDVTVLQQKNAGPSAARNAGIRRARGRYCAFLDADDLMLPELLETEAALLDANPEVGIVLSDVTTFDERGTVREARWALPHPYDGSLLDRLAEENFVTTSAVMAPTQRLLDAGLFPEDRRVAEDYELWLRLASRWQMAFIERPLVRYRYTTGSLSSDKVFSAKCAIEVIQAFWRDHPEYRASHSRVYHRSMGRHLMNAGAAAASQQRRVSALGFLIRSLRHNWRAVATWKWVVKTLAAPADRLGARVADKPRAVVQ
jgi:glycosyltransferase involved in cell wall biosynthesis